MKLKKVWKLLMRKIQISMILRFLILQIKVLPVNYLISRTLINSTPLAVAYHIIAC